MGLAPGMGGASPLPFSGGASLFASLATSLSTSPSEEETSLEFGRTTNTAKWKDCYEVVHWHDTNVMYTQLITSTPLLSLLSLPRTILIEQTKNTILNLQK